MTENNYTDKDLENEFPSRPRKCVGCGITFFTRFDTKYHSNKCFNKSIRNLRKKLGTWIPTNHRKYLKSERNDRNKDTLLIKGTGRRK